MASLRLATRPPTLQPHGVFCYPPGWGLFDPRVGCATGTPNSGKPATRVCPPNRGLEFRDKQAFKHLGRNGVLKNVTATRGRRLYAVTPEQKCFVIARGNAANALSRRKRGLTQALK